MDVETMLDAEIAAALAELPIGQLDFGTWTVDTVPSLREAMSGMPVPPEPPPIDRALRRRRARPRRHVRPDGARLPPARRGRAAALPACGSTAAATCSAPRSRRPAPLALGRGGAVRGRVGGVPARPRAPVPRAARRLLREPALGARQRRRARHRPRPHRDRRRQRGRRARRRASGCSPATAPRSR